MDCDGLLTTDYCDDLDDTDAIYDEDGTVTVDDFGFSSTIIANDTDCDGIENNIDLDDDGDGICDGQTTTTIEDLLPL